MKMFGNRHEKLTIRNILQLPYNEATHKISIYIKTHYHFSLLHRWKKKLFLDIANSKEFSSFRCENKEDEN